MLNSIKPIEMKRKLVHWRESDELSTGTIASHFLWYSYHKERDGGIVWKNFLIAVNLAESLMIKSKSPRGPKTRRSKPEIRKLVHRIIY